MDEEEKNKIPVVSFPDVHVILSYDDIYGDFEDFNPHNVLQGIPSLTILDFAVRLQNKVFYRFSDDELQRSLIHEMMGCFDNGECKIIESFLNRHNKVILIHPEALLHLYGIIFSKFQQLEKGDNRSILSSEEYRKIYLVIMYCNAVWSKRQANINSGGTDLLDVSLQIEIPIVEFKYPKDFKVQLYKAIRLFTFFEATPYFRDYLDAFYKDRQIEDWRNYILLLVECLRDSLDSIYVKIPPELGLIHQFFAQFTIGIEDLSAATPTDEVDIYTLYFRDHFLLKCINGIYLLLNRDLLVDKLYQGIKFDIFNSINKYCLKTPKGKEFKDMREFNSLLGESFSEKHLLYPLLESCFKRDGNILISGEDMRSQGITAEPDYYIREGNCVYLFEYKDVTLGDKIKFSKDINYIKEEILKRLCWESKNDKGHTTNRKGGAQLLYNIDRILNNDLLNRFDNLHENPQYIFPILATTDLTFTAFGVNSLIKTKFQELFQGYKIEKPILIITPIIIDFDTLINLSYLLSTKQVSLAQLMSDYLEKANFLSSFKVFVTDIHIIQEKKKEEENNFLFGGFANGMDTSDRTSTRN